MDVDWSSEELLAMEKFRQEKLPELLRSPWEQVYQEAVSYYLGLGLSEEEASICASHLSWEEPWFSEVHRA